MSRRLAFAALPLAALAFLAAGCGGGSSSSDTSPTTEWAGNLCTAIVTWTDSLTASVNSLKSGDLSKDALQGVANDAKSSTETLIDDLKGLGKPDTQAGQDAQDTLNQLADELQNDVDEIDSAVNDSSASTLSTISTVSTTLGTMGNQLSTAFSQLEQLDAQGELEAAFKQADSCDQLTS
jgi:hypothetical protein